MDADANGDRDRPDRSIDRRTILVGTATTGLAAIAGCLDGTGSEESVPDPVTIEPETACDNCTMVIGDYPGPAGESFYDDPGAVLGEDRPAQFCSSRCTYTFTFDNEAKAEPSVVYLTDYSRVDWEVTSGGEALELSRHLDADAFAPATDLTFVVDSDVHGAMGRSLIGFSDADEAEAFQSEYGGERYEHEEVSRELLQSLMG